MKYQTELAEVIRLLPNAKNVLIALPSSANVDELAAGLALFLSLEQSGKQAAIVTEGTIRVGHTNLFGVGEIQSRVPETKGGDFVITLGGVAVVGPDGKGTVPALEKLDYFTQGADLNLVFKVLLGQKFEPTSVTPHYESGGFDLIFTIGAGSLNELGAIYTGNPQLFTGVHLVNVDNEATNPRFGQTNVVDSTASSVAEMTSQIISSLNLPVNGDIASNILSGIFAATSGLQERNATADTFETIAQALRSGGQKPVIVSVVEETTVPAVNPVPVSGSIPSAGGFDLSKIFNAPPSPEEAPAGEGVDVTAPEADWLAPKIFKGKGNLG